MNTTTCSRGHSDFYANGDCRQCDHEYGARYRARRRAALQVVKAYEAQGIGLDDLPRPEAMRLALAIVEAVDPEVLQHYSKMDPDTAARAVDNLRRAAEAIAE